jgi:hypothetical protein
VKVHNPEIVGPAGQHCWVVFARSLDQHGHDAATIRLEPLALDPLVQIEQTLQTLEAISSSRG